METGDRFKVWAQERRLVLKGSSRSLGGEPLEEN
jgi:hypothetical protein